VLVVDPAGSPSDFGDEPLLIARKLGVPVVVGESRYEAGRLAEQKFQAEMHLLDDGFQHRSLARDFDIVLMTASDLEDRLLPIGRLREPLSSLERADAIILPQSLATESLVLQEKPVWRMQREIHIAPSDLTNSFREGTALAVPLAAPRLRALAPVGRHPRLCSAASRVLRSFSLRCAPPESLLPLRSFFATIMLAMNVTSSDYSQCEPNSVRRFPHY